MTEFPDTKSALLMQLKTPACQEAWEEFVEIYRPAIYRMARRRGMQDADAQDVTQNILVRVSGAIDRYEKAGPNTRFRHWLRRVARNAILSALTRAPDDRGTGNTAVHELLTAHPEQDPLNDELELEARREQFHRAAAQVRGDVASVTWRAFELTVIEGMSCEDASTHMDRSIGTIYAARSRVLRRIRDIIHQWETSEE